MSDFMLNAGLPAVGCMKYFPSGSSSPGSLTWLLTSSGCSCGTESKVTLTSIYLFFSQSISELIKCVLPDASVSNLYASHCLQADGQGTDCPSTDCHLQLPAHILLLPWPQCSRQLAPSAPPQRPLGHQSTCVYNAADCVITRFMIVLQHDSQSLGCGFQTIRTMHSPMIFKNIFHLFIWLFYFFC